MKIKQASILKLGIYCIILQHSFINNFKNQTL